MRTHALRDPLPPDAALVAALRATLDRRGIHALLRELNAASGFRSACVALLERGLVRTLASWDRESPGADALVVIPLAASYCGFVLEDGGEFECSDSLALARLVQQPLRARVRAYAGVALRDVQGVPVGTLSLQDPQPRAATAAERALLRACARALVR